MKKIIIAFLFSIFCTSPVYAILHLELTKGVSNAIPIAVVPFKASTKLPAAVDQIVTQDLSHSGEFKTLPLSAMPQKPAQYAAVNFSTWRKTPADYLVIGNVSQSADGKLRVYFELLNVYQTTGRQAKLLDRNLAVRPQNARRAAHKIADEIYQKLTGVQGIFSTKIAYVSEKRKPGGKASYSLVIADADGYNSKAVLTSTQPIMSPAWSPDGRKIAYVSFEKRRASIYVSDIITGRRKLITQFSGINGAPAFSPDGRKLALVLSKTGSPKIYLMDLRTKKLTRLTKGFSIDTEPAFAPDGQSIIFTSDRSGSPQIYQLNLKTQQVTRLTYDGNYNAKASFTLDGKNIVMLHRDASREYHIATQNLQTGALTVLSHAGDNQSPSFAPNGKMIIYTLQSLTGKDSLGVVSMGGQVKMRLPDSGGSVREPVWGPVHF